MMQLRLLLVVVTVLGLVVLLPPRTVLAETEPNNTMAQANTINTGYNRGHTDAVLSSVSDVDFYKFTTAANQTYVIETYNIAGTNSYATGLWLYNSSGTQIAEDSYGRNGTGQANARIVIKIANAGTYYIKVQRSNWQNWAGTYSLRVLPHYSQTNAGWDVKNDHEPNDMPEIANEIKVGLGNAITRSIADMSNIVSYGPDQDFYRFVALAGHTYVIETYNIVGNGSYATGLWLYNSSGTQIAADHYGRNGTGQTNARIVIQLTTAGTYYIKVKQSDWQSWTGVYSLRVLPRYDQPGAAWDDNADLEPNDTLELANEIGIGLGAAVTRQLAGTTNLISYGPDQDFYRFTAAAAHTYVIETYNIAGTDSYATGLWLYNSSGTQVAEDHYGSNGTGRTNARIVIQLATAGTYFIKVQRSDWKAWTGTYSLRVLPSYDQLEATWDSANDYEPNDVFPLANQINVGVLQSVRRLIQPNQGFVTNGADQDVYRFNAEANQPYLLQTFNVQLDSSNKGTGIYLFNSSGTQIADDRYGRNGEGFVNAQLTFKPTTSGTYFVVVAHEDYSDWTGPYSLRICQDVCLLPVYLPLVQR